MTLIHMDTEQVTSTGKQIRDIAENIEEIITNLNIEVQNIPWQSHASEEYKREFRQYRTRLHSHCAEAIILGWRVNREVEEWMLADSKLAAGVSERPLTRDQIIGKNQKNIYDHWKEMTIDERVAWLDNWYKNLCKQMGIKPVPLILTGDPKKDGYSGFSMPGILKFIYIDSGNLMTSDNPSAPFRMLNTIAHESRHQYQYHLIEHPDQRPANISLEQIEKWRNEINVLHYKFPQFDPEGYYLQQVEIDARAEAKTIVSNYEAQEGNVI